MVIDFTPDATDARTNQKTHAGWPALFGAMFVLIPLAVACGGSSGRGVASIDSTSTASEGSSEGSSLVSYSNCMREHGLPTFPDVGLSDLELTESEKLARLQAAGINPDSPQFEAASEGCDVYLPGEEEEEAGSVDLEALLAFARCMRDNGITNFPDPNLEGGISLDRNVIDVDSPQFVAAHEACEHNLPGERRIEEG